MSGISTKLSSTTFLCMYEQEKLVPEPSMLIIVLSLKILCAKRPK